MEDKIWICIVKRLSFTETKESAEVLDNWINSDPAHKLQFREAKALWEMSAMIQPEEPADNASTLIQSYLKPTRKNPVKTFWKYGIAAALTGALLLAGLHFFNQDKIQPEEWVIHKTTEGNIDSLTLPDESKVWLNAGTEIRFRKNFSTANLRTVELKGEAYFDVRHDDAHPFVVTSGDLKTTVYGTSFNIRAYPNDAEMFVAVNSGRVGVQHLPSGKNTMFLLPKDKLSLKNGKLIRSKLMEANVSSWTQGEMIFEQMPLNDVLATIARKYQVRIESGTRNFSDCKLTARFKDQPLSAVLKTLNISMNIKSTQVGDTIYIKGGNCM